MNYTDFINSLSDEKPPNGISRELSSLWFDKNDQWETAHELIQHLTSQGAARIHAFLHRKEGDFWNANYWYSRANETTPDVSLDEEWELLVTTFIDESIFP